MDLKNKRVLLTGATGGIGSQLAMQLAQKGAKLALLSFDEKRLIALKSDLSLSGVEVISIAADFNNSASIDKVVEECTKQWGGIDVLINNAGLLDFVCFEQQSSQRIMQIMQVNTITPMLLTRALLPTFLNQHYGHIVNIGSIFGSIGFPHYATYSASKFAMRGFSQALRRELFDAPIKVTYIAPRAVKTELNDATTTEMMSATNVAMDDPKQVATKIIKAIEQERDELLIGQPESFFAWLNGVFPKLVSNGLKKQTRIARTYSFKN